MRQPGPEPNLPNFNTVDDIINHAEGVDARLAEEVEKILGTVNNLNSARGRTLRLAYMVAEDPECHFYTDLPLMPLRKPHGDKVLSLEERMQAMDVNNEVLERLYEEAEVDYRQRTLMDNQIGGYPHREIIYPTKHGYAFWEQWRFDYKANPDTDTPTGLEVHVFPYRNGQMIGDKRLPGTEDQPEEARL